MSVSVCVASIFRIINEHFALFLSCFVVVKAVVGIIRYHAQCPSHRHIIYPLNHIGTKCCAYDEFNSNRLRCSMDEVTKIIPSQTGNWTIRNICSAWWLFRLNMIVCTLHCMQIEWAEANVICITHIMKLTCTRMFRLINKRQNRRKNGRGEKNNKPCITLSAFCAQILNILHLGIENKSQKTNNNNNICVGDGRECSNSIKVT